MYRLCIESLCTFWNTGAAPQAALGMRYDISVVMRVSVYATEASLYCPFHCMEYSIWILFSSILAFVRSPRLNEIRRTHLKITYL